MGQASSRGRTDASPSPQTPTTLVDDAERPNSKPETSTPTSRSRRSAVCTNILKLVNRRSSIVNDNPDTVQSRVDDAVPSPSTAPTNSRRRWRTSRRWSHVLERHRPISIVSGAETETSPSDIPSTSTFDKGKDKERLDEVVTDAQLISSERTFADRPSTPFPSSSSTSTIAITDADGPSLSSDTMTPDASRIILSREEQEVSQNIGSWLGNQGQGQGQLPARRSGLGLSTNLSQGEEEEEEEGEERPDEQVVISPDTFDEPSATPDLPTVDTSPTQAETTTATTTPLQSALTPSRQFPPPGTLVVVQGVVHTTDVARPNAPDSSTLRSSQTGATTNPMTRSGATSSTVTGAGPNSYHRTSPSPRLPSLAPAERMGTSTRNRLSALIPRSRPASMLSVAPSVADEPPTSDSISSDTSPESENVHSAGASLPPTIVDSGARRSEDDAWNGNGISNANDGGTISSSSIDVLGTLLSVAAAATAASLLTGSSEPIFTSGLAPPGAAHVTTSASHPDPYATRPMSPTPTAGLSGLGFGLSDADADAPMLGTEPAGARGRDRMRHAWGNLRERLGIPARPSTTPPLSSETGRPMDAREAMLAEMARAFNLGLGLGGPSAGTAGIGSGRQGDGSGEGGGGGEGVGGTLPPEDSFERFLIDLQADLRVALSQPAGGGEQDGSANGRAPAAETSDVGISPSTGDQPDSVLADGASVHVQVTPPDNGGIPPLENLASSDPDFDIDNEDETETATDNAAPPQIPASPPEEHAAPLIGPASTPSSSSRTERRPGGGINWWRLYRFPAITAPPPSQGSSTPANNLRPASFPLASTTPAAGVPPSDLDSTSETTPPIAPPATDTVIPVIVVGLQSVNVNRGQPRTGDHDDLFGDEADTNGGGVEDDAEHNPFPHPFDNEATQRAQRERRWHSRAADAIRNLRPGRRGASRETQPGDAAGSRTFLIYVIGGYYPPDHHIVTGANTLDSFEALWELAELLGQVKPPTATREDIEKSGLEIIKPGQLVQFEKAGKISANCVERCLICLDDYEPEDDVRVMNCRHAFHKSCVDKWLQTGRNNCPACRSRGVSTDGPSSPVQSSSEM